MVKSHQNWLKQGAGQFAVIFINVLILFGIRRNCLRSGRSRSLYLFIRRTIKQTIEIIQEYRLCQLPTKFYQHPAAMGIISVDFDETGQLLIIYSALFKYLRNNGNTTKHFLSYFYRCTVHSVVYLITHTNTCIYTYIT